MAILGAYIVPHPPLIVPAIGQGEEKKIQRTVDAYHKVAKEIGELKPETIIVITPHSVMYSDYIHISPGESGTGDFYNFDHPEITVTRPYDTEFVSLLVEEAEACNISAGTAGGEGYTYMDHGVMVPLHFIEQYCENYKLVRISISGLTQKEHYAFGMCIQEVVERLGRNVVIVASGDLSHKLKSEGPYSYAPEGPAFDARVTADMATADFRDFFDFDEEFCDAAGECGMRGFIIMAGALDCIGVEPEFLTYEGPFGVGYGICMFHPVGPDENRNFLEQFMEEEAAEIARIRENADPYAKLARRSLESFLLERKHLEVPEDVPAEMLERKAGVFVSLKKDGRLRGCIGTIECVTDNIAEEIINNAIGAGFGDTRFEPLTVEELDQLVISVDVLTEPERVTSVEALDPKKYGVIVSYGERKGLLLPDLNGVNTVEQQVGIALTKAGLPRDIGFHIDRFEVVRHL